MRGPLIFRYRDSAGFLNRMNPLVKLILLFILCLISADAPSYAVFLLFLLLVIIYAATRIPAETLFKSGRVFLFIALFIGISSAVNTKDALKTAESVVRYLNIILLSIIFTDCTSAFDISRIFGKSKAGTALSLSLSMLPMVTECFSKTLEAGKARGSSFLRSPVGFTRLLVTNVLLNLLSKVRSYSDALTARCFQEDL